MPSYTEVSALEGPRVRSLLASMAELDDTGSHPARRALLPTGFGPLDDALSGGIRPGEVTLLGGRPGSGKTTAAMQWARSMAHHGIVAIYVSLQHDELDLVTRLLAAELAATIDELGFVGRGPHDELRARLEDVAGGVIALGEAIASDPLLTEAHRRLTDDAERLLLVTATGARATAATIGRIGATFRRQPVVVFVDYIQRLATDDHTALTEHREGQLIAELKHLALAQRVGVVAIATTDRSGLSAARVRAEHLQGSSALAFAADTIVMVNERVTESDADRRVVFTVEKHRIGAADLDVDAKPDFANFRFQPA